MTKHGADTLEKDYCPSVFKSITVEEFMGFQELPKTIDGLNKAIIAESIQRAPTLDMVNELSKRGVRVLEVDQNESYVIASKEHHCIFGEGVATILVIK